MFEKGEDFSFVIGYGEHFGEFDRILNAFCLGVFSVLGAPFHSRSLVAMPLPCM